MHGVVRWRLIDVAQWMFEEFRITIAKQTLSRELRVEIWFADEARVSQKNKITRRWAKRGTRPIAPRDQRTASTYIFGAICPQEGKGAALILPACNTEAMNLHLAEIAKAVAAHAVLLVDQAGWHLSTRLVVPANITIIPLPPKCPELNPVENVWQFMRDNWLSNRIFKSYDDLVDHCCAAWNKLISPGASCPSDCANGRTGSNHWDLVLIHFLAFPDGMTLAKAFMRIDIKLRRRIVVLVQTLTKAR